MKLQVREHIERIQEDIQKKGKKRMDNPESLVHRVTLLEEGFHNMMGSETEWINKMKQKSSNINEFKKYILNVGIHKQRMTFINAETCE